MNTYPIIKNAVDASTKIITIGSNNYIEFDSEEYDSNYIHSSLYDPTKFINKSELSKYFLVIYFLYNPDKNPTIENEVESYIVKNGNNNDRYCYHKSKYNNTHTAEEIILLNPNDFIQLYINTSFGSDNEIFKSRIQIFEIVNKETTRTSLSCYKTDPATLNINTDRSNIIKFEFDNYDNLNNIEIDKSKIINSSDKTKCYLATYFIYTPVDYYSNSTAVAADNKYVKHFWLSINDQKRSGTSIFRDYTTSKSDIIILEPGQYVELCGYMYGKMGAENKTIGGLYKWNKVKLQLFELYDLVPQRPEHGLIFYNGDNIQLSSDNMTILPFDHIDYQMKNLYIDFDLINHCFIQTGLYETYYLVNYQFYHETQNENICTFVHSQLQKNNTPISTGTYYGCEPFVNITCIIPMKKDDKLSLQIKGFMKATYNKQVRINTNSSITNSKLLFHKQYIKYPKMQIYELGKVVIPDFIKHQTD